MRDHQRTSPSITVSGLMIISKLLLMEEMSVHPISMLIKHRFIIILENKFLIMLGRVTTVASLPMDRQGQENLILW